VVGKFKLPFSREEILALPDHFARLRSGKTEGVPPGLTAEKIGGALFSGLFSGKVGKTFARSLAYRETDRERGLRIRLSFDFDDPDVRALSALPWELIWDEERGDFLSRTIQTPIARYLPVARPPLFPLQGNLRVLCAMASPSDMAQLDLEREWNAIQKVLKDQPGIEVCLLPHLTLEALRDKLRAEVWHVFHFMGHGGFHEESGAGCLYFESAAGTAARVTGKLLGEFLKSIPDLRLVFLNACKTGKMVRRDGQDPYSATAAALVQAGVPAVLAMQAPVSDMGAIEFSSRFYKKIVDRDPVDCAVVEGRLAVLETQFYDWATPVLFTRVQDSDILGRPVALERGEEAASSRPDTRPLGLGIRTFSDSPDVIVWDQDMEKDCEEILDLRDLFEGPQGRYIKDPASWQTVVVPRLREFLASASRSRRPLHINLAAHASLAFAAGYFLEAKSGLEITIRQRVQGVGLVEWQADAAPSPEERLFLEEKDADGDENAKDVAVALAITRKVTDDVRAYLSRAGLAVHRTMPLTIAPEPFGKSVRDGLHALQLAQVIDSRLRARSIEEREGTLHLFASAPNALLFFLGQLSRGLGRIQLYEYDFATGKPGAYCPSIVLPPDRKGAA
jgi:hypothetical protein